MAFRCPPIVRLAFPGLNGGLGGAGYYLSLHNAVILARSPPVGFVSRAHRHWHQLLGDPDFSSLQRFALVARPIFLKSRMASARARACCPLVMTRFLMSRQLALIVPSYINPRHSEERSDEESLFLS